MTLREMIAARERVRTELRALHTAADNGTLAEPAQARWDVLTAELATLDGQERRQALIDEFDRACTRPALARGCSLRCPGVRGADFRRDRRHVG